MTTILPLLGSGHLAQGLGAGISYLDGNPQGNTDDESTLPPLFLAVFGSASTKNKKKSQIE